MSQEKMLEKKVWAVIGANQDDDKFGCKIYKRLKSRGYDVYAVNPAYEEVDGDKCYKDLSSLPKVPDVVEMVVSPKRGKEYLEEAARLGVRNVWFQPGTCDEELLQLAKSLGFEVVQSCVLVATKQDN